MERLWVMSYGLWVMGYGLWVMGYELWVMSYELWVVGVIYKFYTNYFMVDYLNLDVNFEK
jgi:hypothetical protein